MLSGAHVEVHASGPRAGSGSTGRARGQQWLHNQSTAVSKTSVRCHESAGRLLERQAFPGSPRLLACRQLAPVIWPCSRAAGSLWAWAASPAPSPRRLSPLRRSTPLRERHRSPSARSGSGWRQVGGGGGRGGAADTNAPLPAPTALPRSRRSRPGRLYQGQRPGWVLGARVTAQGARRGCRRLATGSAPAPGSHALCAWLCCCAGQGAQARVAEEGAAGWRELRCHQDQAAGAQAGHGRWRELGGGS